MRRLSWLDSLVYGFQHRWETNPQYRAAVSGVVGLTTILVLCACLGILTTAANAALAGFGVGSGNGLLSSSDTGTGKLAAGHAYPTATAPTVPAGALASSPIPNSQTPKPAPTDAPTPTDTPTTAPCTSNCGGGGGGGCNGSVSGSGSPSIWVSGQSASVNVHTSCPDIPINIIISFPSGATILNNGQGQTDGSGNYSFGFTVPQAGSGQAHALVQAGYSNGLKNFDIYQPCR